MKISIDPLVGIGTLLIGISSCIAVKDGKELIREILEIKGMATDINRGVKKIDEAVMLMQSQIKTVQLALVADSKALKDEKITKKDVQDVLSFFPTNVSGDVHYPVYIPPKDREKIADALFKADDPQTRKAILYNAIQVSPIDWQYPAQPHKQP